LGVLGVLICYGGVVRLVSPPPVDGTTMVAVALTGVVVNLAAVRLLQPSGGPRSLNVEGAYRHVMSDLLAFVLTAAAGVVVLVAHFRRADGIAALVIAAIMLRSAYVLLRASGRVLLEASPEDVNPQEVGLAMAGHHGVVEVHDLHVWELTSGFPALSAHVVVGQSTDCHAIRAELEELLRDRFAISHSTLQVEHAQAPLLRIEPGLGGP
jgi:cobalt-zinc-cadmium efflux system protein